MCEDLCERLMMRAGSSQVAIPWGSQGSTPAHPYANRRDGRGQGNSKELEWLLAQHWEAEQKMERHF